MSANVSKICALLAVYISLFDTWEVLEENLKFKISVMLQNCFKYSYEAA